MKTSDHDGYLWVTTNKGKLVPCTRVCGAVSWGDASSTDSSVRDHALVVGGEAKDGSIQVFHAFVGPWMQLVDEILRVKNDAWCLDFWVDPSAEGRFRELFRVDGLTFFLNILPPDDKSREHKAKIQAWWTSFRNDLEGSRTMVDQLREKKIARVDKTLTGILKPFWGSEPEQIQLQTPKATIALIWHMWKTSEHKPQTRPKFSWEGNNG